MKDLNSISSFIEEQIASGIYDITITLSEYDNTNTVAALVTVPSGVNSISFIGNGTLYLFGIHVNSRNSDISISLENIYMNSKEYMCISMTDTGSSTVTNSLLLSGNNTLMSEKNMAIGLSNNQTLNVELQPTYTVLAVYGGIDEIYGGYCAIGNSAQHPGGGHINFSGDGLVYALGGNGADTGVYADGQGLDGGHGIGFLTTTTSPTSITINCNLTVQAYGGRGQACGNTAASLSAGSGGAGISVGINGVIMQAKCTNTYNLSATGGAGGEVLRKDYGPTTSGGDGGSAIAIGSGKVELFGSSILFGGQGTGVTPSIEPNNVAGISGGDGGDVIEFTALKSGTKVEDVVILADNTLATAGIGAGSSPIITKDDTGNITSVTALDGGDGGHIINGGANPLSATIGDIIGTTGYGGKGADTSEYQGIDGADKPGKGGNSGAEVYAVKANINLSEGANITNGLPGVGGTGIDPEGNTVPGTDGDKLPLIDIIGEDDEAIIHFGYFNISRTMNIINPITPINTLKFKAVSSAETQEEPSCEQALLQIKNLYISQIFNACLGLEDICIEGIYDIASPSVISISVVPTLTIKTSITAYTKNSVPILINS